MEDRKDKQIVQQVFDSSLSGIQDDPWMVQRVLSKAHEAPGTGGFIVKKKMSAGLIFAIVMMLLTVTAVAAVLLSGKDFVNQFLAPMSSETAEECWSEAELSQIFTLAEENGVEITDEIRAAMESNDPVYKEELLRLFMKIDLGYYPAAWPLEEQAWYDELLVKYGLTEERTRFLPTEGEISQKEALNIACEYILDKWSVDVKQGEFILYQQYMLSEDETGKHIKMWDIEYESADGTIYVVCLRSDGSVIENEFYTYVHQPEAETSKDDTQVSNDIWDLAALMREDSFYTVDTLAHFRSDYAPLIEAAGDSKDASIVVMRLLLDIPYAEPKDTDITPDRALALATDAAVEAGWTEDWLGRCKFSVSYRDYADAEPVYRICFKLKQDQRDLFYNRQMPFGIVIQIHPVNGDVISIVELNELDEFDRYCEFPDPHDSYDSLGNG